MLEISEQAIGLLRLIIVSWVVVRILKTLYIIYKSIMAHYLQPIRDISEFKPMWTVITGCTDGIGRAYVEELVSTRGIRKLCLIARNGTKLAKVKKELEERFGADVQTIAFDFEKDDLDTLPSILKTLEIGILVNCVGIAPDLVDDMLGLPEGLPSKIIRVNLLSTVKMIEMILPGMVKRNRGIIVNVSSMTCWRPLPYLSTYPASKAGISFFSSALNDEFKNTNVRIQCLIPLLVATKVAAYDIDEKPSFWVISTKDYARQAVRLIGNVNICTGCKVHDFEAALMCLLGSTVFKTIFVPFGILGMQKKRVAEYFKKKKLQK